VSKILLLAVCWLSVADNARAPESPNQPTSGSSKAQRAVTLTTLLDDYSRLTGRTVLRSSALPNQLAAASSAVSPETEAAVDAIERHLLENGVLLTQDGPLFVRAVPISWTNSAGAEFLATVKPPADAPDTATGTASFGAADLEEVLRVYSKFRTRTLLRSRSHPSSVFVLKTVRDMTKAQLAYGMTVLLAPNGIAAVDDGEHLVQLVPVSRWREVSAQAPKPLPEAPVLDPGELPSFKPEAPLPALNHLTRLYVQAFRKQPPWTPKPLDELVQFYAELAGLKASPSPNHGKMPVWFEVTSPLTKEELLYAFETSLRLEGLAINQLGEDGISVISLGEQQQREKKQSSEPARR
jgi:hypothetical protein